MGSHGAPIAARPSFQRAALRAIAILVAGAIITGCGQYVKTPGWLVPGGDDKPQIVDLVAVMPIREVPGRAEAKIDGRRVLDEGAGRAVTAQVYGRLTEQTRYRFVPDLSVDAYLEGRDYRDPESVAPDVAEEFGADAVLFGTVYRFQDRVGTRFAASEPASVSFELALYLVATKGVVWRGEFDETQQALSTNFFDAWMFWRAGPHWLSSRELAGLGVEKLLESIPRGEALLPIESGE